MTCSSAFLGGLGALSQPATLECQGLSSVAFRKGLPAAAGRLPGAGRRQLATFLAGWSKQEVRFNGDGIGANTSVPNGAAEHLMVPAPLVPGASKGVSQRVFTRVPGREAIRRCLSTKIPAAYASTITSSARGDIGPVVYAGPSLIHPAASLTESQKACLRLVAQGMTSKEIAQRTGLSHQTVDTYLKTAMAKLKSSNRREAARALLEFEQSQNLGSPSPAVDPVPKVTDIQPTVPAAGWVSVVTPPPLGGTSNELSTTQRTFAVLKVAALSAAILVSLTLLIAGFMQTFR